MATTLTGALDAVPPPPSGIQTGAMLAHALEFAPVMIWISGADQKCTWFNQQWLQFVGRPLEAEVGDGWTENVHPEDLPRCLETYSRAFAAREPFTMEYRLRRHDGEYRFFLDKGVPTYGPDGEFTGYVGSCFDITERRQAEDVSRSGEASLRMALNAGRMGTFDWDLVTNCVYWSPELEAMHGYKPGEFPGTIEAYRAEIYPEDFDAVQASAGKAITTGAKHYVVYRIIQPDGSLKWVEGQGKVIFDDNGNPARLVGVCCDVHERVQAEAQLARRALEQGALYQLTDNLQRASGFEEVQEASLEAILVALNAPRASILLFDDEGFMRFVAHRGLSGEYRKAVEGHSPWDRDSREVAPICIADADASDLPDELKSVVAREGIRALSFIPLTTQGRLIGKFMVYYNEPHEFDSQEIEISMTIARQLASGIDRLVAEDFRRQAESDLRRMANELEAKVRERTADLEGFAYSIAHDMRQHIRGVSMNAYLVSEECGENLSEDGKQYLERLLHAARHMNKLTDDILTHTRIGVKDLAKNAVDLSEIAARVADEVIHRAYCNPNTEVSVQPGLNAVVDPAMFSLVLENLLDNACKFSAGSSEPKVWFGRDATGFYVKDNGIGFDSNYANKIFNAFERLEPTFEGTGIGLASVKRIIERHGGRVWAEGDPGKGAAIRFSLPA